MPSPTDPALHELAQAVRDEGRARALMDDLRSPDVPRANAAAMDVMAVLWSPAGSPEHMTVPARWWSTPLGITVAQALSRGPSTDMPVRQVAAVLGVSRQRVYQLVDGGRLARGGPGKITRDSLDSYLRSKGAVASA